MQKDLSTVSFVYLAASALSSDCVYLINVYKAKRYKTMDPQSPDTVQHFICHHWGPGDSPVSLAAHQIKRGRGFINTTINARILLIKVPLSYL